MIYITAMRVRSPGRGVGYNVFAHHREQRVPESPWTVSQDPGKDIPNVKWVEIPSGGNSVEAFLDIMMDDELYSLRDVQNSLEELARQIEHGAPNPFAMSFPPIAYVEFSVNIGLEDLPSRRRVLENLSDRIQRCLRLRDKELKDFMEQARLARSA